jgi:hypothetical protein
LQKFEGEAMQIRQFSRLLKLTTVLTIGLVLAGCAGATAPATPVPLIQNFQSGDGTISFNYPDGWIVSDAPGLVTIANSQAAIEAEVPAPGQFQARLFTTPISAIEGLGLAATPRDVLQFFAESLSTSGVTFNAPADLNVGSRPAARIEGSGTDGQGLVIAMNLDNGNYAFVSAISAPGEISRFEPTLLAILESLAYTALPIPETP